MIHYLLSGMMKFMAPIRALNKPTIFLTHTKGTLYRGITISFVDSLPFINSTLFYNLWYSKVQQMVAGISADVRHQQCP
jgi:hypothetical protein